MGNCGLPFVGNMDGLHDPDRRQLRSRCAAHPLVAGVSDEATLASVRFGRFMLDRATRQLTSDGTVVHLTPKAFNLLSLLVEEAPRVVEKGELHRRLWPDSFVSDATHLGLMKELRRALRDDGDGAVIRTVHGVGYAFAAPLQKVPTGVRSPLAWVMVGTSVVPLHEGENVIGRDEECRVRVELPSISRRHARIVVTGLEATIEDLGSRNGTKVGGQAITGRTGLREGNRIQVGDATMTFQRSATNSPKETLPSG